MCAGLWSRCAMDSGIEGLYSALIAGLFVCWLLPLGVLCGLILLGGAVRAMWRTRGLEQGGLYCPRCRFNLRGCASWNCPECGGHLDDGRVLTTGVELPMGLFSRMVLVTVLVAGPIVFLGVVLATVWPGNYVSSRELTLYPLEAASIPSSNSIRLYGSGERAWYGKGRPTRLSMTLDYWKSPPQGYPGRPRRDTDYIDIYIESEDYVDTALTDELWPIIYSKMGFEDTDVEYVERRAELDAVIGYMAGSDVAMPELVWYQSRKEQRTRYFEPTGWFVVIEVVLAVVVWFFVMRWVVRWHDRVHAVHARTYARVNEQMTAQIARNRAAAGLGAGAAVNGEE
ncbi:hypothetical protein OT109_14505 [Phycisphaeraceae bacterium D3-23]